MDDAASSFKEVGICARGCIEIIPPRQRPSTSQCVRDGFAAEHTAESAV